jgi:hypothetical protein
MGMALLVAAVIAFALAQSQQAPPTNQNARMAPEWMRSQSGGCSDVR